MASLCGICLSIFCALLTVQFSNGQTAGSLSYRGRYIGPLTAQKHKVSGEVYAVDSRTIHIAKFTYDGTGPDAFFWTGFTDHPSPQGLIIPNEKGTKDVLGAYNNQDITISLPDGLTLRDIKWIAVWCREYEVNFGDLYIPANLDFPQPHVVGSLLSLGHGVSSGPIVIVDSQTVLIPDFNYDGKAPDLHFWVGRGVPGPDGIRVPDETGTDAPLVKADKKTMVLSLPGDLTVFDIDYFGVFCRLYSIDFGHVRIPPGLNVPPSLRMLGIQPQKKLNCEVLHEESAFELRWSVVETGDTIVFQMVSKIDDGQYMAVGFNDRSVMVGADAMIGWFDRNSGRGFVDDYHLGGKSICQGSSGACPDVRHKEGANNIRLLSAAVINGFTILTFQRKLRAMDPLDKRILTNGSQPVIWAIGSTIKDQGLAGFHDYQTSEDFSIDFGRSPQWNCPQPQTDEPDLSESRPKTTSLPSHKPITNSPPISTKDPVEMAGPVGTPLAHATAWQVPPIPCSEPEDGTYYVHVGPSGRQDVFQSVTGINNPPPNVWYINGLLMPTVYLVRGRNYTFVVQGGERNGFYITTDKIGDLDHRGGNAQDIFAGVEFESQGNTARATAFGKLCIWRESQPAHLFASYAAYQRTLSLDCGKGQSGVLRFSPNARTPSLLYYQSFSNPNMGWKIHILDHCGEERPSVSPTAPSQTLQDQSVGESNSQNVFLPQDNLSPPGFPQSQPNPPFQVQHGGYPPQSMKNAFIVDTSMIPNQASIDGRFPMKEIQAQGSIRQPIIAVNPGGNGFHIPQNPGLYQIAVDTSGDGNSFRGPQNVFHQMPDNSYFQRRHGQSQLPNNNNNHYNKYERPEGFSDYLANPNPSRPPLISGPQIMYATTPAPQRRTGFPYPPPDQHDRPLRPNQMHSPPPPSYNRRPGPVMEMGNHHHDFKFVDHPLPIMPTEGIQMQQQQRPPLWFHSRNLPKRESRGERENLRRDEAFSSQEMSTNGKRSQEGMNGKEEEKVGKESKESSIFFPIFNPSPTETTFNISTAPFPRTEEAQAQSLFTQDGRNADDSLDKASFPASLSTDLQGMGPGIVKGGLRLIPQLSPFSQRLFPRLGKVSYPVESSQVKRNLGWGHKEEEEGPAQTSPDNNNHISLIQLDHPSEATASNGNEEKAGSEGMSSSFMDNEEKDRLSLTVLEDVLQIINQEQRISIQSSSSPFPPKFTLAPTVNRNGVKIPPGMMIMKKRGPAFGSILPWLLGKRGSGWAKGRGM